MRDFHRTIARDTRGITVPVGVTVDPSGIRDLNRQLAGIRGVQVSVGADASAAVRDVGAVDRLLGRVDGRRASARVSADVGGALRDVGSLLVAINAFATKTYHFRVEADTAGAVAAVARLSAMVAGIGGGAGIAGGLAGALGGLAPVGAAAAGGLGSVVLASAGVGDALKAMSAQQQSAGVDATAAARKQAAAAETVRSAQERAASAATDAARARRDAARSVADAEQQAADSVSSALAGAQAAHRSYAVALTDVRRAQSDLNRAYEDGRRALQDIQDQLDSSQIDQRQAALDLRDALERLNAAKASGDVREIERAQIAYDRQVETVDQLGKRVERLKVDNAKAQAAGVQGTEQVTSATQRLADANATAADAKRAADTADAALTRARSDAVRNVALAQEAASERIADADRSAAEAQRALTVALAQTGDEGSAAGQKVAQAFAELSPPAAAFAKYLFSLKPILDGLQATAAAGLFPGLTTGIAALVAVAPQINTMVAGLSTGVGSALSLILTQLASPEWISFGLLISEMARQWLPMLAGAGMQFAGVLRDLLIALIPLAPAGFALLDALAQLLQYAIPFLIQFLQPMIPAAFAFLGALRPLFPVLVALSPILATLGVLLAQVLGAVLVAVTPVIIALTPLIQALAVQLATGLVNALVAVTPFLITVATWLSENPGLVLGVVGAIGTLLVFLKPLAFVLGAVVTVLHNFLIITVVRSLLAGLGLEASFLGRAVILLLSPIDLFRRALSFLPRLLPLIGSGLVMIGRAIVGAIGPIGAIIGILGYLFATNEEFRASIMRLFGALGTIVGLIIASVMPIFGLFSQVMSGVGGVVANIADGLATALIPVIDLLTAALEWLTPIIVPLVTVFLGIRGAILAWSIAQGVLNVVMAANPITVVVVAIAALVGAVVWAYQNVDWFRETVDTTWQSVKVIFQAIGDAAVWMWENAIKPAIDGIVAGWNGFIGFLSAAWTNVISPVLTWIGDAALLLAKIITVLVVAPIVLAWEALSALFRWTWDTILKPVLDLLGAGALALWNDFLKPTWDLMKLGWEAVGTANRMIYDNVIRPVIDAFGWLFVTVWETVLRPTWENIKTGWRVLSDGFTWVYDNIIRPVFDLFAEKSQWFSDRFATIVEGIKRVWAGIQEGFKAPVRFVINTVWNDGVGFLWNKAKTWIPLGDFPRVDLPPGFANGGVLPGYRPGVDTIPAMLSPGEAILRPEVARAVGADYINQLNYIAKQGPAAVQRFMDFGGEGPQHFALGGIARTAAALPWALAQTGKPYVWGGVGPAGYDCSGFMSAITNFLVGDPVHRRRFTTASFAGGRGAGGFIPGLSTGFGIGVTPNAGGGIGHMAGTLLGVNVESRGGDGVVTGPGARGATNSLFPWKFSLPVVGGEFVGSQGGGGGGDFGGWFASTVLNPAFDFAKNLVGGGIGALGLGDTFAGKVTRGMSDKILDGVRDWITSKVPVQTVSGTATAGGNANVNRWGGTVQQALKLLGLPMSLIGTTLNRMERESGGNPRAINLWDSNAKKGIPSKGLMQVIDPTFRAFHDARTPNDIWDPLANIVASMRYAINRYGSLPAGYNKPGGYDSGGWLPEGDSSVFNGTRRPEAVLTGPQWESIHSLASRGGDGAFTGTLTLDSGEFLGVVHGVVQSDLDDIGTSITHGRRG
jgi:hypothetical protein